jgi:hypothetical protein
MPAFTATPVQVGAQTTITVPGGSTGTVNWFYFYRSLGGLIWKRVPAKIVAGVVQLPISKPLVPIEYYLYGIDSIGATFTSETAILNLINSPTAITHTEIHVPARAKVGEPVSAHAFTFQVQNGSIVQGSLAAPARDMLPPVASSLTTYTKTGNYFLTTTSTTAGDEGAHIHAMGYA